MKRFVIFLVLLVLFIATAAIPPPPAEAQAPVGIVWDSYAYETVGASANALVIPGFQPQMIYITHLATSGGLDILLTVYVPQNAGPASATDSFVVFTEAANIAIATRPLYLAFSDTMRLTTVASVTFTTVEMFAR